MRDSGVALVSVIGLDMVAFFLFILLYETDGGMACDMFI